MKYIGIDPGQSGAITIIDGKSVSSFPFKDKTDKDILDLFLDIPGDAFAIMEKVHGMPGMGGASMFTFGASYGLLKGILYASIIPFDLVPPQRWMKHLNCMTKGDKNVTKTKAQQLYPHLKITHSTADSILIATYCKEIKSVR